MKVTKQIDASTGYSISDFGIDAGRKLPSTFIFPRNLEKELPTFESELGLFHKELQKEFEEATNVIVKAPEITSSYTFAAFTFAMRQILYNQSYISGNTSTNSGLSTTLNTELTKALGRDVYRGVVEVTLADICKLAFGTDSPTPKQKVEMKNLINTLDRVYYEVSIPETKSYIKQKICSKMTEVQNKYGAIGYRLALSSAFSDLCNGFGELPQDITKRMSLTCELTKETAKENKQLISEKLTTAHLKIVGLLSMQNKQYPYKINVDTIMEKLGLFETYKKFRSRAEEQLMRLCYFVKELGMVTKCDIDSTTIKEKKVISQITFYLSPTFGHEEEEGKAGKKKQRRKKKAEKEG